MLVAGHHHVLVGFTVDPLVGLDVDGNTGQTVWVGTLAREVDRNVVVSDVGLPEQSPGCGLDAHIEIPEQVLIDNAPTLRWTGTVGEIAHGYSSVNNRILAVG